MAVDRLPSALRRRDFFVLTGALGLAACARVPTSGPPGLTVTFAGVAPLRLDVSQVEFVDAYRPPLQPPNVEHQLRQTPAAAVRDWTRARLQAVGATGTARVTVYDASIVAVPLPTRRGVGGLFTNDQDTRYDGALEVGVETVGRPAGGGQARTKVVRSRTVPESLTVNQRDQVFYELVKALLDDLDRELVAGIRQYMSSVIRA